MRRRSLRAKASWRHASSALLVAIGCACHAPPQQHTATAAAPPDVVPLDAAGAPQAPSAPPAPPSFRILPEPVNSSGRDAPPRPELSAPPLDAVIELGVASGYVVRLRPRALPAGYAVRLAFDREQPRTVVAGRELTLIDLVALPSGLHEGEHVIAAWLVGPEGRVARSADPRVPPATLVRFWIGTRGTPTLALDAPFVVINEPAATLNGPRAADEATLDWLLLNAELGPGGHSVALEVSGPELRAAQVLTGHEALALGPLQSGDYRVQLRVNGPDRRPALHPFATATRFVTVNRELMVDPR